jgi:hypothetical protein
MSQILSTPVMLRAAVLFIAAIAVTVVLVVAGSLLLERRFSNGKVAATFVGVVVARASTPTFTKAFA